ncbi:MAG: hypothetical protein ABSF32_11155 [Ignavibacteria bacterium]
MARKPKNSNKEWSISDKKKLKDFARKNTTTESIARHLGRSKDAVYSKASELQVSLKPLDKYAFSIRAKGGFEHIRQNVGYAPKILKSSPYSKRKSRVIRQTTHTGPRRK